MKDIFNMQTFLNKNLFLYHILHNFVTQIGCLSTEKSRKVKPLGVGNEKEEHFARNDHLRPAY